MNVRWTNVDKAIDSVFGLIHLLDILWVLNLFKNFVGKKNFKIYN